MPFFAKSSHFVPVTRGKSTQARLRRVQVGVLWEKTAWNLNISDLERLLLAFVRFFPPSLVQILHICHKDGGALMHSWQGGYHKSQRGIISENPEKFRIKTPLALASQTDLGTIRLGFHLEMAGRVSRKWL